MCGCTFSRKLRTHRVIADGGQDIFSFVSSHMMLLVECAPQWVLNTALFIFTISGVRPSTLEGVHDIRCFMRGRTRSCVRAMRGYGFGHSKGCGCHSHQPSHIARTPSKDLPTLSVSSVLLRGARSLRNLREKCDRIHASFISPRFAVFCPEFLPKLPLRSRFCFKRLS